MANSIPKIEYNNGTSDVTIEFDFPPLGPDYEGKNLKFIQKVQTSTSGALQTADNYDEEERSFSFKQIRKSIANEIETFMLVHGGRRKTFKYFIHKDELEFIEVKVSQRQKSFRPKRTGTNSTGEDNYSFKLRIRRVL